jgi:S-DNA-T family DNA segregation ATPase FtsK/SpoIIIE
VSPANGGWGNLFKGPQELIDNGVKNPMVDNWLGKFGALLSNQFIYQWFGIASFIFVFIFFVIGYRLLFKVKLYSLNKTFGYGLFGIVFLSVTIGFVHGFMIDYPHFLEGEFGYWTNLLLDAQIGQAGAGGLLVFAGLTALIIAYNIDFKIPERQPKIAEEFNEPIQGEPVELVDEEISLPVEWPKGFNTARPEPLKAEELVPEPVFHEPVAHQAVTLTPTPAYDADEGTEIPLSIEVDRPTPILGIEQSDDEKAKSLVDQFGTYDHKLELAGYKYPPLDLLENHGSNKISVSSEELEINKNKIVETLNHYNIEIDKIKATIGPTVTLYEIIPAPGVRISKIKNLEDDIALSLAALGIRIIAPMPGKGTIGIEVPNQNPEMVSMRSVLATDKFQNTTMDLPIALGKTISNEVFIADLAKMPHLLVAGATGQGKSVGINAILVSLLYKKHPSELKFVLVDPKKVELTLFRKIERHFLAKLPDEADAIITDTKKVVNTLNSLCIEMDQRYDLLKDAQVRNLKEYNTKYINRKISDPEKHRYLPFIVLVIDEFADLMMTAGKEVEQPIARIAQLARAVGIHLVIATQRPSVNVITGTIKANFPARLAFRVLSKIDSRTILDAGGADQLIGRGDMLLSTGSDLIRLQCAFVDTPEVEKISDYIGNQKGYATAMMLPEYVGEGESSSMKDFDADNRDPMFEEAARLIVMHQQGSTSLIQRKLKLGYNRAGRIIDQLEAAGIVGPFEGSKAREVLYPDEYSLLQYMETLENKD